jgi:hypothetical protein
MTAGGGVVEDAGSAAARPVDAPEPHGPLVLGVIVAPLVSVGFLLARPSSPSTPARRRPVSLPAQLRSTRHDTGGSAWRRLAPAPLHGRSSLLLLLSDGAQEGEKRIPRRRRTRGEGAQHRFMRVSARVGERGRPGCSAGHVARIQVRQRGWGGAIGMTASSQCGATPGRYPLASAGEKGGGTEVAGARAPLVSERKEEKGRGWRAVLGYGDGLS